MKKLNPKNITKRSHHLAELIVYENLRKIRKKVKEGDESLARHEGQFAIDVLKIVHKAVEEGKPQEGSLDPDKVREQLRLAFQNGKSATA